MKIDWICYFCICKIHECWFLDCVSNYISKLCMYSCQHYTSLWYCILFVSVNFEVVFIVVWLLLCSDGIWGNTWYIFVWCFFCIMSETLVLWSPDMWQQCYLLTNEKLVTSDISDIICVLMKSVKWSTCIWNNKNLMNLLLLRQLMFLESVLKCPIPSVVCNLLKPR